MATDNCTLCSPLYAKGAIFSWSDVVNLLHQNTYDVMMCVIISLQIYTQYFVDTLQRMAYPCIIQTQQPILPPTCLEITTESLFLGLKCTFHQHIVANRRHRLLIKCSPTS